MPFIFWGWGIVNAGWNGVNDGDELPECFVFFDLHKLADFYVSCAVDAVELMADEVDNHQVLCTLF